jgi:hypothetical protein
VLENFSEMRKYFIKKKRTPAAEAATRGKKESTVFRAARSNFAESKW